MDPVFQRQDVNMGGIFTCDKAKLALGSTDFGVLVQGLNFTFSQNVTRLYEIGTGQAPQGKVNVYYVGGRTQGQAQLSRVIGPKQVITEMYKNYGDVCNACKNDMVLNLEESDCCPTSSKSLMAGATGGIKYTLQYCVLTQVGVSLQAQDMIINEQSQIMFSGLQYENMSK